MKAVLVMDMPDNCGACKLSSGDGFHLVCPFTSCGIEAYIKTRYEGCPLREPTKEMQTAHTQDYNDGWSEGWNACIDKILDN